MIKYENARPHRIPPTFIHVGRLPVMDGNIPIVRRPAISINPAGRAR
jgi:hypothetical protein